MNMKRIYTKEQKEAKSLYDKAYRDKNKERLQKGNKNWREANKEFKKERDKQYSLIHKEDKQQYDKAYRELIKDKKKENDKKYYQKNKARIKVTSKKYTTANRKALNAKQLLRKANDPLFKLKCGMRSLIKQSFKYKGFIKNTKTEQILGCTFTEFKMYIENQFEPWMNWENKGNPKDGILELNKTWDIDHHIPMATAKTIEDVIKLNHHTNLRPLCSYTNRYIKIAKV